MGNSLSLAFLKLLEERRILRVKRDPALVKKELAAARSDLKDALDSLRIGKCKWATIQG